MSAVRVSPTWTVPPIVGAPAAAEFAGGELGPGTMRDIGVENFVPSALQRAPDQLQLVATGIVRVMSLSPSGSTRISQRLFRFSPCRVVRRTLMMSPFVTVKMSSRMAEAFRSGSRLNWMLKVNLSPAPPWFAGEFWNCPVSGMLSSASKSRMARRARVSEMMPVSVSKPLEMRPALIAPASPEVIR